MIVTVDGVEVDMDVSQVGISYAIGDPLEPGVIAGNRSTTFKMPATNRVRAVMGGPAMAERPISGDPVLRFQKGGTVYLEQKIRPIEWDREEVRSVSIGNNAGWFEGMKAIKLPEMDLGESPRIDVSFISASWFDEDALAYFPLIDYGYTWDTAISATPDLIRPGTRTHVILKKAFASLGYTLKVKGSLASVWKKFILPCTLEPRVGQRFIDNNTMTVEQLGTSGVFPAENTFGVRTLLPPSATYTLTDIGGNVSLQGVTAGSPPFTVPAYQAAYAMRVRVVVDMVVRSNEPVLISELNMRLFNPATGIPWQEVAGYPFIIPPLQTKVLEGVVVGEIDLQIGDTIALAMYSQLSGTSWDFSLDSATVRYEPIEIDYQENITVDMDSCVPKISAWDIIQGINYSRCLAFDTDDRTKVVTVSYYDEKYRPISEGIDLVGREDHTDPPVKGAPLKPKRIIFGWKDDGNDLFLERANTAAGERGWGGLIRDIEGGTLKERKIEMPFAATAMRTYPEGVTIPVMREHDDFVAGPDNPGPEYKWAPRLLLEDGTAFGEWDFNGAPYVIYPKCFFVFPGETDLTMSFYPETQIGSCGPGNVAAHYGGYLRRLERSKTLSVDLMLYDQEMKGLDFGIPVQVLDDFGKGWYYFTEVKQKKFDVDEPTRCELIQV